MTTQEMLDWFNILQDKFGGVYYDESHQLTFLNRAQYEYLNQVFPSNEGGLVNIEENSNITQNVDTLIYELSQTAMNQAGIIAVSALITDLQTLSGDADSTIFKILSIEYLKGSDKFPCKYLRHNDKGEFERNYFKKPSIITPRYLLNNGKLNFRPIDTSAKIYITVVKTPVEISLSPSQDCELPVSTHNEIVAYALNFAGIASRDEILAQMNATQLVK